MASFEKPVGHRGWENVSMLAPATQSMQWMLGQCAVHNLAGRTGAKCPPILWVHSYRNWNFDVIPSDKTRNFFGAAGRILSEKFRKTCQSVLRRKKKEQNGQLELPKVQEWIEQGGRGKRCRHDRRQEASARWETLGRPLQFANHVPIRVWCLTLFHLLPAFCTDLIQFFATLSQVFFANHPVPGSGKMLLEGFGKWKRKKTAE